MTNRARMMMLCALAGVGLSQGALGDGGPQHQAKQTLPVKMGTSGGENNDASSIYCCGGTLGALVVRDGVTCILSNNHVLARSGSAVTGDDTIQPGLIDSGCSTATSNVVGDFAGNLVPLGSANVDTALSVARAGMVDTTGAILDIGVPCSTPQTPAINMSVMKSGRTTGFTTGTITSLNTSVSIQYQKGCNSGKKFTISFTNQIVTGAMSAGGDSGSVLFSNDGSPNPVGLLFAGSSATTIFNPIQSVINAYTAGGHTFTFVGNNCLAAADPVGKKSAPSDEALAMATAVKVEAEFDIMRQTGVWGIGVGASPENPEEPVIVIYMEPPSKTVTYVPPRQIEGVRTRVIFTDPFVAQ